MKNSLTAVHITNSGNRSGGTRQALLLCEGVRDAGHRVVFGAPPASWALRTAQERGLEVHPFRFGNSWGQWKASRQLRTLARSVGADVVHTHHTQGHNVALLATFGGGFPPVIANRGVLFRPEFPAKFRSSRTAAIITNSRTVKRVLADSGIQESKISVVYNAKELPDADALHARRPSLREELGLGEPGPVVGLVGRAAPAKGFQFFVEAAPGILARFPGARFILVGSGTERFESRLAELGVRDRFVLPGHRNDAIDVMSLFDLFVIPSIDMESCPNVLLEAMSVGLPAVGTDVGGIPEMIVDGITGRVVAAGQPQALSDAVIGLLEDRDALAGMGMAGRQRVADVFSLDAKVRGTLAVYEKALEK